MKPEKSVLIPPDGGWGWMIVFASGLSNMISIPIMQGFGLIFKDKFKEWGMSATDATVIININSAFGMALGLINGPLLRHFGYRKVAVVGSLFVFVGVLATAWSYRFTHFIISYGIITSIGIAVLMASFSLALNTYFKELRSKAMGYAMTLTGVGPIIMPQVISFCLGFYGVQGTMIVLAGLSLHCLVGSLLLQPVRWHAKKETISNAEEQTQMISNEGDAEEPDVQETERQEHLLIHGHHHHHTSTRTYLEDSLNHEVDATSIYGIETPDLSRRNSITFHEKSVSRRGSRISRQKSTDMSESNWASATSLNSSDYHENRILEEEENIDTKKDANVIPGCSQIKDDSQNSEKTPEEESFESDSVSSTSENERNCCCRVLHKIYYFFDFDLFTDPKYVNLILGMSIAIFAEINFSLLTPFILNDFQLSTIQIATVMSVVGFVDVIFRFGAPFVGEFLKFPPKIMYLLSLLLLIISRSCILFFNSYLDMLLIGVFLGIAKGFRTVYMSLVIPAYVPLERLASASGLQMVVNGILLLIFGPIIGVIRDYSENYSNCIIFINGVTFITVIMWTLEELWSWRQRIIKLRIENEAKAHNV